MASDKPDITIHDYQVNRHITLVMRVKQHWVTSVRFKLCLALVRLANWVAGFGGVEIAAGDDEGDEENGRPM